MACVVEPHDQTTVRAHRDRSLTNLLLPQHRTEIARVALLGLPDRPFEINLHQEVNAAAEIESQVHRQRADSGQPDRGRRREVERDDVLAIELVFDDLPSPQLILSRREAHE